MGRGVWAVAARELIAASRRPSTYSVRVAGAASVVVAVGLAAFLRFPDGVPWEAPPSVVRGVARIAFGISAGGGLVLLLSVVTRRAAGSVAGERERGTLSKLLTTRLTSFEIVAGKFASTLGFSAACLASALPLLVVLDRVGGVDPRLALFACAGLASTAFLMTAASVAVSVWSRGPKTARGIAVLTCLAWVDGPFTLAVVGPRVFPSVYAWVAPVNRALMESSPLAALPYLMGIGLVAGSSLVGVVARMVAYQVGGGLVLAAFAVATLRPADRWISGGGAASVRRAGRSRLRLRARPPCGDDPMGWKERYVSSTGWVGRALGFVTYASVLLVFAYVTWIVSWPAWTEMAAFRSGASSHWVERWRFNQNYVRPVTGVYIFVISAVLAGSTPEAVEQERKQSMWLVLLSTPLSGREILGAKRAAALRRWGPFIAGLLALFAFASYLGAVHPAGLVAATLAAAASVRFASALGAYTAVATAGGKSGVNRALVLSLGLMIAAAFGYGMTERAEAALLAVFCPPFLCIISALTRDEVWAAFGSGEFDGVMILGIHGSSGGAKWLLATAVLGPIVLTLAAHWMERESERRFDASVGRPVRTS